jgi:2-polyprenyl-6-methoxyphenol hydroxylase-like FAD-dependent oxidoreductase
MAMLNDGLEILALEEFVKINEVLAQSKSPNCWGIFDRDVHPLSTSTRGRIYLVGDAAHASSPHVGTGASMRIKDSPVIAELLRRHLPMAVPTQREVCRKTQGGAGARSRFGIRM